MRTMLLDMSTYRVIQKDLTSLLQKKMNGLLLQLKKDDSLPPQVYNRLRYSSGSIESIYGLPKIHKSGVPLRPIVLHLDNLPPFKTSCWNSLSFGGRHVLYCSKILENWYPLYRVSV